MKKGHLAIIITSCLVALGCWVALITNLRSQSRREARFLSAPFVLLDELAGDPSAYDGRRVAVPCYLWPGAEGMGLSTMPTSKRWNYDAGLKRNVCAGTDFLAKGTAGWDFALYGSMAQNDYQTGERLVVVEGYVHNSGYGQSGSLLQASPYLELDTCRPLLTAGGHLADATMEE